MEQPPISPPPPSPDAPGVNPFFLWSTLAATFVSFVAGVALGFLGRPLLVPDKTVVEEKIVEVVVTATPIAQATPTAASNEPPSIMDFVMSDARHIQGQADAPITIVEFSDFK